MEYINDGNGKRRLRQVTDTSGGGSGVVTAETWYRWAGLEEIGEYEQGGGGFWDIGTKTLSHIPGLGEVAGASQATGDYRYYLQDHLGSTRSILDGAKAPLARYAYTPYGQSTVNVGLALNVGYTGHAWDDVTQQWFAPYRYYDPSGARWLWRDPLGFVDGPNMYGYVGGSPINLVDPTGESQDSPSACARNNPGQFIDILTGKRPNKWKFPLDITKRQVDILRDALRRQVDGHKKNYMDHLNRLDDYRKKGNWKGVRDMRNHMRKRINDISKNRKYMDIVDQWSKRFDNPTCKLP